MSAARKVVRTADLSGVGPVGKWVASSADGMAEHLELLMAQKDVLRVLSLAVAKVVASVVDWAAMRVVEMVVCLVECSVHSMVASKALVTVPRSDA